MNRAEMQAVRVGEMVVGYARAELVVAAEAALTEVMRRNAEIDTGRPPGEQQGPRNVAWLGRLRFKTVRDLEIVDGVTGFRFDMSGLALFHRTWLLRAACGRRASGDGGVWSEAETLAQAMQGLAREVSLDKWSDIWVETQVTDVSETAQHGR